MTEHKASASTRGKKPLHAIKPPPEAVAWIINRGHAGAREATVNDL